MLQYLVNMDTNLDYLKKLLEEIRKISFWQRIFSWKRIKNLLVGASTDLQKLLTGHEHVKDQLSKTELINAGLSKEKELSAQSILKKDWEIEKLQQQIQSANARLGQIERQLATDEETITNHIRRKAELDMELGLLKQELKSGHQLIEEIRHQNILLLKDEEFRKKEHAASMSTLKEIREQIEADRKKEKDQQNNDELLRIHQLKETWSNHEDDVRNTIKKICSRYVIQYVDKVPFKGAPDNAIKICDEFVLFDAKSPAGDDLSNFPAYLKDQSEKAAKYAKEENVKKDIFLVVPSNTLPMISQFIYRLAEYNVFVISLDALEPVILNLQKLEEYEFAEQLSPEERENICRVLGKFAHLAKRRIQIDSFFIKQFMELAYKAESDLPKEVLDKVVEFEKAEKLNPPVERRSKQINLKELEKDISKLNHETGSKGIAAIEGDISIELNKLPLYTEEISGQI